MHFKGDVIITDPCYLIKNDDWEKSGYGDEETVRNVIGLKTYLCRDTIYGDWSCTTYERETHKELGNFCADAGLVCVALLSEVLAYNKDFDYHTERTWTTTLLKDFDGEIDIEVREVERQEDDDYSYDEKEVQVVGEGNINFFTSQTGL